MINNITEEKKNKKKCLRISQFESFILMLNEIFHHETLYYSRGNCGSQ